MIAINSYFSGAVYGYYFCHRCRGISVSSSVLNTQIIQNVGKNTLEKEYVEPFSLAVRSTFTQMTAVESDEKRRLEHRLNELSARKSRLIELSISGVLDPETAKAKLMEIAQAEKEIQYQISTAKNPSINIDDCLRFCTKALLNPAFFFESASVAAKKEIIKLFFPSGLRLDKEKRLNCKEEPFLRVFERIFIKDGSWGTPSHENLNAEIIEKDLENARKFFQFIVDLPKICA